MAYGRRSHETGAPAKSARTRRATCAVAVAAAVLVALPLAAGQASAAKPDFRVAVPSSGDVTVALVTLRGPKLPARPRQTRKRPDARRRSASRLGGPRLRVTSGPGGRVSVLGGIVARRVGNRRVYRAMVAIARPIRPARRRGGRPQASSSKLPNVGLEVDSLVKSLNRQRADRLSETVKANLREAVKTKALPKQLAERILAEQRKIEQARKQEDAQRRRNAEEQMKRELAEALRRKQEQEEANRRLLDELAREHQRRQEEERRKKEEQRRQKEEEYLKKLQQLTVRQTLTNRQVDRSPSPKVKLVSRNQAKNAIANPGKTGKLLGKVPEHLIDKIVNTGGSQPLDPKALRQALIDAKKQDARTDPLDVREQIRRALELLKNCLAGGGEKVCSQPQQPQDPEQPKQPEKPKQPEQPKQPVVPPPPPAPRLQAVINHAHDGGYGWFYCVHVSTDPPQPGAEGIYGHRELDGEGGTGGPFVLDHAGKATIAFERFDPTTYAPGFWTMVALDVADHGPLSLVFQGPGFGPQVDSDECGPPWLR